MTTPATIAPDPAEVRRAEALIARIEAVARMWTGYGACLPTYPLPKAEILSVVLAYGEECRNTVAADPGLADADSDGGEA